MQRPAPCEFRSRYALSRTIVMVLSCRFFARIAIALTCFLALGINIVLFTRLPSRSASHRSKFQSALMSLAGPDAKEKPTQNLFNASLRGYIRRMNAEQHIANEKSFGRLPSQDNPGLQSSPASVFVIQMHNRPDELEVLLSSLSKVKGIKESLIIFSMDVVSDVLIKLINGVQFARTASIFFPHSIQTFSDIFPGTGIDDCPDGVYLTKRSDEKCFNEKWPDTYGHYRNGSITQTKHHWLWKTKFIFEHFEPIRNYPGYVIFLEDDLYVLEDILHVTRLMEKFWDPKEARGFLAFSDEHPPQDHKGTVLYEFPWRNSIVMGISRAMWKELSRCMASFCNYDDYNWDWSLQFVNSNCMGGRLLAVALSGLPRVYHLGECRGMHHNKNNCSAKEIADKLINKIPKQEGPNLYPEKLEIIKSAVWVGYSGGPNGGWGDPRDRALCVSILENRWTPVIKSLAPHLMDYSPIY
ncbi:unnamed protein product [Calicophoron daubneyi]|uniref:Alpha-1,6-mannosyl-glycoprotein 2-beta-N-acetylglucosaminyltransferase n=1 Tax=Calicophoron daubneyi TaxID=300641 RepID=A0AAV2TSR7_CALDB